MNEPQRDSDLAGRGQSPLAALRRFARPRKAVEQCELCSQELPAEHAHLLEFGSRRLLCTCDACALLFSGQHSAQYRRIPRQIQFLPDFHMTDAQWEGLGIPINLAFFFRSSAAGGKAIAMYPSPAGATQSLLGLDVWDDLVDENPTLAGLKQDVESLLVNRVGQTREHYIVPIDQCYKLVGLIRTNWRGLSGGAAVWGAIAEFFAGLKQRATIVGGAVHA